MKQFLIILMTITVFAACQNNTSGGGTNAANTEEAPSSSSSNHMTVNNGVVKGKNTGSFNLVNAPGRTAPVQMLTEKYWTIKGYIQHGDDEAQEKNVGRWYKFDSDGTFESGRWQNKTANGSWTFDEKSKTLQVDSNIDAEDSEWVTQMTAKGGTMVIIGTRKHKQTHIQGKMVKLDTMPVEGEFGKK